mgnify:CR=1 FL=1
MNKKYSNWLSSCLSNTCKSSGYALDLACGKGRNSIYLAKNGFQVLSVDIDCKSLDFFSHNNIKKKVIDVEKKSNWPLVKNKFDIVVVTNFLNRQIFPLIIKSLNKKGFLIYETFSKGHEKIGRPKNEKFILKKKELIKLSKRLSLKVYEEVYVVTNKKKYCKQRIFCEYV